MRRTNRQKTADLHRILDHLATVDGWIRRPDWVRQIDLDTLVHYGKVERDVRVEYDRQHGTSHLFGGAGVVRRRRAYYRLAVAS